MIGIISTNTTTSMWNNRLCKSDIDLYTRIYSNVLFQLYIRFMMRGIEYIDFIIDD